MKICLRSRFPSPAKWESACPEPADGAKVRVLRRALTGALRPSSGRTEGFWDHWGFSVHAEDLEAFL